MKIKTAIDKSGYSATLIAYVIWGVLPIYWKFLKEVPPLQVMLHRILWSFVFLLIISLIRGQKIIRYLENFKTAAAVTGASFLLSANWFTYIYAVHSGKIVEASMGYYISPLLSIMLGLIVFKEKLTVPQKIALFFATAGVIYIAFDYGEIPYIALFLAFSFSTYGLFKKYFAFDSLTGLMTETIVLLPLTAAALIYFQIIGTGAFLHISLKTDLLLAGAGIVTAVPFFLFGKGANKIPLSSIGFLQYIAPTLMLLTGVLLYGEEFTVTHIIAFSLIWTGLAIYSYSLVKMHSRSRYLRS